MRGIWWKGLLPDNTPENRMDMIAEYQTNLALPQYIPDYEAGVPGPVTDQDMNKLDSLERVLFSCYTILTLSNNENQEGRRTFALQI